ncbi:type III polyketide synthase [Anaerobacillus alkaliphilus]|uniref:Type III polyketide synthase n=1 Tax=Anaerobacillus alkaliphilus TaxID=1548597 RepID=A0A4Q0VWU6_9BACI|nr:type III polyketide synthase [Anaerobacillus alkaliphilus]RXJ02048.1 type III polyketide synthase [Anaerobacillus alkaliphilus]
MPIIASVSTYKPPYTLKQEVTTEFARELFSDNFHDIERLLPVFSNGQIEERQFSVPLDWFREDHSFQERNDLYIDLATKYGAEAIKACLNNNVFLEEKIAEQSIDSIIMVSSSGVSTPSLDARIMNTLPFNSRTKRIPLWGLGCAGGASGIARGLDYCKAYPNANVLVVCVELCSLTFQKNDRSKSNLIGTSLFADGVACALLMGDESAYLEKVKQTIRPSILASESTLMANSENVMGWDVKNTGLHVVFSRDIPTIIKKWLQPNVESFLNSHRLTLDHLVEFIAHPGGKKVLDAYVECLKIDPELTRVSQSILQKHGNMSSPTVLYVLEKIMEKEHQDGDYGLMAALGPGFSSELVLIQWKGV